MGLAVLVLGLAVLTAMCFGGAWHRLGELRLRSPRLLAAAVVAQAGGALLGVLGVGDPRRAYVAGLIVSAVCAAAFCLRNLRVRGLVLVTAGLVANAVVVGLNGAMPVSIDAALRARVPIATIAAGLDARHEIAGRGTTWRWLGDVVAVPLPWRPEVVSPGDVLVVAGLAELVVLAMMGWSRRREPIHGQEEA